TLSTNLSASQQKPANSTNSKYLSPVSKKVLRIQHFLSRKLSNIQLIAAWCRCLEDSFSTGGRFHVRSQIVSQPSGKRREGCENGGVRHHAGSSRSRGCSIWFRH